MKNLTFASVAAGALLIMPTGAGASDSFSVADQSTSSSGVSVVANGAKRGGGMNMPGGAKMRGGMMPGHGMKMPRAGGHNVGSGGYMGPRGKWHGGMKAPGGYQSYRRPHRGFVVPSYWINPSYSIGNYWSYGLSAPSSGYYWSRYYDDAVMMNNRGYVYQSVPNVNWDAAPAGYAPQPGYPEPEYGPVMQADQNVYGWGQGAPDPRIGGTTEAGTYEGQWTGGYIDEDQRTYRGQWDGQYTNEEGQVYEGSYRGTMTGDPVYTTGTGAATAGAPYPVAQPQQQYPAPQPQQYYPPQQAPVAQGYPQQGGYAVPAGYGRYEQCLKSRGLAGGAIGAILGGFTGNRIAGRGDRLAGTLIGGGIGALAGVGIEKATNKCKKYLPRQQYQPQYRPQYRPAPQVYYPQPQAYPQQHYGYGWMPGYYPQQQQAAVTTVTIIPGTATTTTTTTEEVYYDTVYQSVPSKGKGLRRPAPARKRCKC